MILTATGAYDSVGKVALDARRYMFCNMSVKIGHYTGEHIFLIVGVIMGKNGM